MTGIITSGPFRGMGARHYGVAIADPAWRFATYSNPDSDAPLHGSPGNRPLHYSRMSRAEILALPVADLMKPDAALILWITGTHLKQGVETLEAWGFRYSGFAFVWVKATRWGLEFMGQGYGPRANAEIAILGRRGQPRRLDAGVRQLIVTPVREHSRKPYEAHRRARRLFAGPYVELFARLPRPGWTCWGNEIEPRRSGEMFRASPMNAEQIELARCQQVRMMALASQARAGP